jgi:hypothetical protein
VPMKTIKNIKYLILSLLTVAFIYGCSDSGPGIKIVGLSAPKTVSVVSDTSDSAQLASQSSAQFSAGFTSNTDYSNEKVDSWVKVGTGSEVIEEVNYMLCIIALANTYDYPNLNYRARHNAKNCRRASGNWPLYGEGPLNMDMIVSTNRVSNSEPYKQTMWFKVPYGTPSHLGYNTQWPMVMDMDVTKAPSGSDTLGEFSMKFTSYRETDAYVTYNNDSKYDGYVRVYSNLGKKYLSAILFSERGFLTGSDAPWNHDTYLSMIVELDGSGGITGRALMDTPLSWKGAETSTRKSSKVAFNSTHINEKQGSDAASCSSRTNLHSTVWDYKAFYKDNGAAVNMSGGFPITYTLNGVADKKGWADRWGLWTKAEGDAPTVVTRENGDKAIYNLVKARGKLLKLTKGTRNLTTNEVLNYWYNDVDYNVTWNGSAFTINGSSSAHISALNDLNAASSSDSRWPWSRRLNQSVKYSGTAAVTYFANEDVKPWHDDLNGGNLTLKCYQFCPEGEISQTLAETRPWNQASVQAVDLNAWSSTGKTYTFNAADQKLYYGTTAVELDPDLSASSNIDSRMRLLSPSVSISNHWDVDNQTVHYRWRTGTQEWNQSLNFKNSSTNAFYEFSDPVKFDYTHLTANDANDSSTYNNLSYVLEYDGGLQGFPSLQQSDGSWTREINLKSGDIFNGKAKIGTREIVIKAVGIEKNPSIAAGQCGELPLDGISLTLPSSTTAVNVSKTWADQANVTGISSGYKVIDGVAQ